MNQKEYQVGDLVGEYKPWRHAFDEPFYQITEIKDDKYTLERIKSKQLNFVYVAPIKDAFVRDGKENNKITAVLFRKENMLARKRDEESYWKKKYGDFINYGHVYENGEYGYSD